MDAGTGDSDADAEERHGELIDPERFGTNIARQEYFIIEAHDPGKETGCGQYHGSRYNRVSFDIHRAGTLIENFCLLYAADSVDRTFQVVLLSYKSYRDTRKRSEQYERNDLSG